ncbi:MAG: hypothetical protein JJU28_19240 [Cyclobacteriaceae bacterium]|nr:hypothetical protein [Cyclobacteriaceae bacterium]
MKKTFQLLFFNGLVAMLCFSSCKDHSTTVDKELHALYSKEIIEPIWDSRAWSGPQSILIDGEKAESDNKMFIFSRWNVDSLYFFFKVEDNCLRAYQTEKDHPKLYLDDMVEVLIDTQNDKDSCWAADDIVYHINILGVKKDDRGSADCQTNPDWDGNGRITVQLFGSLNDTTDTDQGYLVTLALAWTELMIHPEPGLSMGINFANGDNNGKGRQLFDWVGAWPMRSPYAYGNLKLTK